MTRRTRVVLGLGNPLRGDDGVGLAVAAALSRLLERKPIDGVRVVTSERGGLEVLPLLAEAGDAVVVDCLEVEAPTPGRVHWLSLDGMPGSPRVQGEHEVSLAEVLQIGRVLGVEMPASIVVLAIEAQPGPDIDDRLSPALAARVERIAALLHQHLSAGAGGRPAQGSGLEAEG
jgi:hydrogenase maturation protease